MKGKFRKTRYGLAPMRLAALFAFGMAAFNSVAADEAMEKNAARMNAAYMQRLQRQPRPGTALDKIYDFHVDRGSVDDFLKELSAAATTGDTATLIAGLIEQRRGRFESARTLLAAARVDRPEDSIAAWHHGQVLRSLGQNREAAEALEAALKHSPTRRDQAEIFQQLGRIYQRTQPGKALELWQRFETAFPGDTVVQEKIAGILLEESRLPEALARYESLVTATTDPYRKIEFGIQAAEILLKQGNRIGAIDRFETQLAQLKTGSWQSEGIRDRIEYAFLQTNDLEGLVSYYSDRLKRQPDDLAAVSRFARHLSAKQDHAAARKWLQKAIAKAPSNVKLREDLIREFTAEKNFTAAADQYEQLTNLDSGNGRHLERWGRLVLRNESRPIAERRVAAAKIWRRLLKQNADDPAHVSRVADLFRSAGMVQETIELLARAIEIAPQQPQFVEYLGEYLYSLNRRDEALATFGKLAAGDLRTTESLTRLSKVLAEYGYEAESLQAMEDAVSDTPRFADHILFAKLLTDAARFDQSMQQLDLAEAIASTEEETQLLQQEKIQTYLKANLLPVKIQQLQDRCRSTATIDITLNDWQFLGLMQEAAGNLSDAARSLQRATKVNPKSLATWTIAARIMEKAGLLAEASAAHSRLAEMDRRTQVDHLRRVAELEQQLGRSDKAMQAAEDVVTAAPDNPQAYRFFADMCFRLGKPELAVDALRRTVRTNPGDRDALISLAEVLAKDFHTEEAIDLYWRAFGKTEDLNARVSITRSLTSLYLRIDQFRQLTSRLRSGAAKPEDRRDVLLCLSNAFQAAGDLSAARATLEDLLQENPRDVALLREATGLAEQAKDPAAAIRYQRRVVQGTRSSDEASKLASLLLNSGDEAAAAELWATISAENVDAEQLLNSVEQFRKRGMLDTAAQIAEQLLSRDAGNYRAMLSLAVISWQQDNREAALAYCERITSLSVPVTIAPSEDSNKWNQQKREKSSSPFAVQQLAGLVSRQLFSKNATPSTAANANLAAHQPSLPKASYQEIRCAALTLQAQHHQELGNADAFLAEQIQQASALSTPAPQAAWDCFYVTTNSSKMHQRQAANVLQPINTPAAQFVYLMNQIGSKTENQATIDTAKLKAAYQAVAASHSEWLLPFDGIAGVIKTLNKAGDQVNAEEIRRSLSRKNASPAELYSAWQLALAADDVPSLLNVGERFVSVENADPVFAAHADTLKTIGWSFSEVASTKIAEGDWDAAERLLTGLLDIKAAVLRRRNVGRSSQVSDTAFVVTSSHRTFQSGRQTNSVRVATLAADKRFSKSDINLFVNLERLAGDEHWPRLLSAINGYRSDATADKTVLAEIALAHLMVLHGDQNAAAVHLVRAAALAPEDAGLRLRLADYYVQANNEVEALALLDTFEAVDHFIMERKETLALQLASSTGNPVRAKQAAKRLFGLRLDTDTSIKLATKMRTLELNEMADALLSRVRRKTGNGIQTLESLMSQYRHQGNSDLAAQIAQQILQETNTGARRSSAAEAIRASAVKTLAQLGQLDSAINRTQQQLDANPDSVDLLRSLTEFYRAAGRSDEALAMATRLAEVQPNSIDQLLRLAAQYEKVRNFNDASSKYIEVLKQDPQRFTQNYYQYLRTFRNANRLPDLADVLLTVDLRKLNNNYYVVGETIEYLFNAASAAASNRQADPNHVKGLELLAAAWRAFPNDRSYLLNNIRDPEIWNLPVMFDYAREGMIPATPQQAIARPWRGIAESPSFGSNGEIIGTLTRVLRAVPDPSRLSQFTAEIEAAVVRFPNWHGGKLIVSVLTARAGNEPTAQALLNQILDDPDIAHVPTHAAWLISAELEKQGNQYLAPMIRMLERSISVEGLQVSDGYGRSAGLRLASLHMKSGQMAAARSTILDTIAAADRVTYSEPGKKQWQQMADLNTAAKHLAAVGAPLDAIALCRQVTLEKLVASEQYKKDGFANRQFRDARQFESSLSRQVNPAAVASYLSSGLRKSPDTGGPAIDLMLTMPPTVIRNISTDHSIVLKFLKVTAGKGDQLTPVLSDLLKLHPNDASVGVAAFVYAEAKGDSQLRSAALQRLLESRSDPIASDVALWFVARLLLKKAETRASGAVIAERAESVADARWLPAILKERGEIAIRRGDPVAAETAWERMLDVVVPPLNLANSTDARGAAAPGAAIRELRIRLLQAE